MAGDPGHPDLLTWFVMVAGALGGWLLRSFGIGSRWGRLEQQVTMLANDFAAFKGEFGAHLAQDSERQLHLDNKLGGLARDLNQLIGEQRAHRGQ